MSIRNPDSILQTYNDSIFIFERKRKTCPRKGEEGKGWGIGCSVVDLEFQLCHDNYISKRSLFKNRANRTKVCAAFCFR